MAANDKLKGIVKAALQRRRGSAAVGMNQLMDELLADETLMCELGDVTPEEAYQLITLELMKLVRNGNLDAYVDYSAKQR